MNILVPTDHGATSRQALRLGLWVAKHTGGTLHIPHAHTPVPGEAAWSAPHFAAASTLAAQAVRWGWLPEGSGPEDLEQLGFAHALEAIPTQAVVPALIEAVRAAEADLMILGTEARRGMDRLLHGSVAERLARASSGPSLFLPADARPLVAEDHAELLLRKVLMPVDRKDDAALAIAAATELLDSLGATEVAIHVLHLGVLPGPRVDLPDDPRWTWTEIDRPGTVLDGVPAIADGMDVDLVVMCTRGHDSLMDSLFGSRTEHVVRHGGRPVLAVPLADGA